MNYIQRDKKCLPELAKTSEQFKKEIVGKSRQEAYAHYDSRKSILKYNTEETTKEFKKMNYMHMKKSVLCTGISKKNATPCLTILMMICS